MLDFDYISNYIGIQTERLISFLVEVPFFL